MHFAKWKKNMDEEMQRQNNEQFPWKLKTFEFFIVLATKSCLYLFVNLVPPYLYLPQENLTLVKKS